MRTPARAVLRTEQAVEVAGEIGADGVKIVGDDPKCDSAAKVHQPRDGCAWSPIGGLAPKVAADFRFGRGRKRMEHREMRGHLVAFGRIVAPAKRVEPGEVGRGQLGGDDQRAAHRPGQSSLGSDSSLPNSSRVEPRAQLVSIHRNVIPVEPPESFADTRDAAVAHDQISDAPLWHPAIASTLVPRSAPLSPTTLRLGQQRHGKQRLRPVLPRSLAAAAWPPSSIRAWRPSQRQTPNRLRHVRTTFVHSEVGLPGRDTEHGPGNRTDR